MEKLRRLLEQASDDCKPWIVGKIPKHFKRITVSEDEAFELACLGAAELGGYFDIRLYFCQALIAGAVISEKYDNITVVSPSQYGKSWLMGHIGLYQAYKGHPQFLAAAVGNTTEIIMRHVINATQEASPEIIEALTSHGNKIEKLAQSLNKEKIALTGGGFIECVSLGDAYNNKLKSNAIGRGGDYILDEAALISDEAIAETGRSEFAKVDGTSYMRIMISNPHRPGYFYDTLTGEAGERDFILWMDACTAVEEERWSKSKVLNSEFAKDKSTRIRYLLCELEEFGDSMFVEPVVDDSKNKGCIHYLGVDAAYKGKDNICIADVSVGEKIKVEDIAYITKKNWIDGVTSEDIINIISNVVGEKASPLTCIDSGYGVWLIEGLAKRGVSVKGINFAESPTKARVQAHHYAATNASNIRPEMHLDLMNLMEDKSIVWDSEALKKVKDIFPYVSCERKMSGKIQVKPKPAIKAELGRSPDELDSVLLAIHAAILCVGEDREFIT